MRSTRSNGRCRVFAFLLAVGLLPACGGGGETNGTPTVPSAFVLKNNALTYGGQANTHLIVGYRLQPMGGGEPVVSGPIGIAPGASVEQPVPAGAWNLSVTYDDGRSERLQIPPDQVDAPSQDVREVTFLR